MSVEISTCTEVDDEVVDALVRLIPQLSRSAPPPTHESLRAIVDHEACTLLLARHEGRIVGSLTLVMFPIPTGLRAWIEDVVVDGDTRGMGVGELINRHAIELAASAGVTSVDLTSRPSREAANRLYQRIGFEARETNVYRYSE